MHSTIISDTAAYCEIECVNITEIDD